TVRRERCQIKFNICIVISILFQYLIYYFEFTNDADVPGMPISKILTLLMISFLIFGGGLLVYGGWSRIGIYIFGSDLIIGIADRLYWAAWEMITHRPVEQAVIYYEGSKVIEWNSFFAVLLNYALLIPLLIGAYKLRNRPLRPAWLVKAVVIIYLILGASPLVARTGMEDVIRATGLITIFVWVVLFFLLIMTITITAARENRRILFLRKQVITEQGRILMGQKEKLRRLRHDVKKHLSNLDYILKREPEMNADPSFLKYRELLNANEEWMRNEIYCDSSVMNLCLGEIKRYCDSRGIALDIILKRLDFSKWTDEDQLMFGTMLLDLLEMISGIWSIAAVHYSGDQLMGQNVLRIMMETTEGDFSGQNSPSETQQDGKSKDRKLLMRLEKDIRLVLSKYEGRLEREEDGDNPGYMMSWAG
ncbi:MAG: hypothetical protein J6D53_00190, partial [Blautia sp.]|nr:hypothetical protein [Blautia sp.]